MSDISENLEPFLKETNYCDYSHSDIQKIARQFKKKYPDKKELAVALFYYVRDNILYRVGHWNKKASETLFEGRGSCTNKANLLVALMRVVGMPAGYGLLRVKGREYFGEIVPSFLKKRISKESIHIHAYVYLKDKWIKCDPADDKKLSENTSYFNPQSKLVDWDGKSNAMLNLDQSHILNNEGLLNDIDHIMSKKPRNAKGIPLEIGNLYVEFLRWNDKKIKNTNELEPLFKKWLKKYHILYYYFFSIGCCWEDLKIKLGFNKN